MSNVRSVRVRARGRVRLLVVGLSLGALALLAGSAVGLPEHRAGAAQKLNLDDYPKHDSKDLPEKYRRWIDEEVLWIATKAERDVFLRLDSDERRDRFIEEFWRQRDPTPGTERNEYRDLHYQRFEYANHNFGHETPSPGWRTDRGHVWILLGKPQTITRLPNTNQAVPAEVWFYSVDPALGLPPFFYLIFFRDRGVGEYRLYSPAIDGPMKLLNASAQQEVLRGGGGLTSVGGRSLALGGGEDAAAIQMLQRLDPELGNAAASLIPGEAGGFGVSPLRSEIVLARMFDLPHRIMPRATWAYNVLTGVTESDVRFETLPMEATAAVLFDDQGVPFVHFVTRTRGDRLNLNHFKEHYYVTFSVSAAVHDDKLRFLQQGEPKTLQADLDDETARRLRGGPVQYMERVPLIPGHYTLGLVLENNVSREFGRAEMQLDVPDPAQDTLWASAPVLALETHQIDEQAYDPYADHFPFQVARRLLVPAVSGPFPTDASAWVFRQLRVPLLRGEPLLLRYRLYGAAGARLLEKIVRVDVADADEHGIVNAITEIDLHGLPPGQYRLQAEVLGMGSASRTIPLRIQDASSWVQPFVHALRQPPSSSSEVRLARARELRTVGRTEEAIAQLQQVLQREPDRADALALQLDLLTDAGRYGQIAKLLAPRLVQSPNDTDLLLRIAEAKAKLADHYDAIRYYERARLAGAKETPELLNSLASEYYAQQSFDKVRALLQRSLQLDPDQPEMARLLQELPAEAR